MRAADPNTCVSSATLTCRNCVAGVGGELRGCYTVTHAVSLVCSA